MRFRRSFGGLSSLEDMRLEGNELTGEIPEDLGDLTELRWLGLGHNELTGEIVSQSWQTLQHHLSVHARQRTDRLDSAGTMETSPA